jgi:hypothetical protein
MSNYTLVPEPVYKGYPIQPLSKQRSRSDILEGIFRVFSYALANYSKILFIRFDLHYPKNGCDVAPDVAINRFRDSFIKNRARQGYRPLYTWCREQETSSVPDFHFVLVLDGQRTKSIYRHQEKARELWYRILRLPLPPGRKGLLHPCDDEIPGLADNGIMIQSSDPNRNGELDKAFRWASCLARTEEKGNGGLNTREWGRSQV